MTVYTPAEAAAICKVSTKVILAACRSGKLPAGKAGREWRITEEQLRAYLAPQAKPARQQRRRMVRSFF